jgi:hypothetical protein
MLRINLPRRFNYEKKYGLPSKIHWYDEPITDSCVKYLIDIIVLILSSLFISSAQIYGTLRGYYRIITNKEINQPTDNLEIEQLM